jgi:hypothetical protein
MSAERQMVWEFFKRCNLNIANPRLLEFKLVDWEHYANGGAGRVQERITAQTLTYVTVAVDLKIA